MTTAWTLPLRFRSPNTRDLAARAPSAPAFSALAEIALVYLDLAGQQLGRRSFDLLGNELTHLVEAKGRRVLVHARQGSL